MGPDFENLHMEYIGMLNQLGHDVGLNKSKGKKS